MSIPSLWLAGCLSAAAIVGAAERPVIDVAQLDQAPTVDGLIDTGEWSAATVLDQPFVQFEPEPGQPSSFRTVVRIGQTSTALYVAFEAYDDQPSRLAAAVTRRDGDVEDDDSVAVLLDTLANRRTAYRFQTNALATQEDGRIADNGRTIDATWDAAWSSAASRLEDRWVAEIAIPFNILRYQPGPDRSWGINLLRTVPRRLETSLWAGATENRFRVADFGTLGGLDLPRRDEKRWQLIPYLLATTEEDSGSDQQIGGDLRWRPSSSLGIDATINPDFALIEADVEEINLSRFELFIPEKRPFFLEGSETYRQRIRQFYSRRIGDIDWGGKAIGSAGKTNYSVLSTSGDVPATESRASTRADYSAARVQHSLPRGSTVGLLGANRHLAGVNQGSVGIDTTLFFTDKVGMTAQLSRVNGPTADGGLAWFLRPAYDSNTTHFHIRYTNLDPDILRDFNATGFLRDDDRREWDTNLSRTFWIKSGAFERVEAGANYNRYSSHAGVLRSDELETSIEVDFRNKWQLELEHVDEFKLFEKEFDNELTTVKGGWDSRKGRSVLAAVGDGVNFDSDLTLYALEARWTFGDRLRTSYSATRLELEPDPEGDTTWIHVVEGVYSLNPDNLVKLFVQRNSAIDKVNVQAVWIWRFRPPFGSFQLAYQSGTSEQGQASDQGDTILTKLAWVF